MLDSILISVFIFIWGLLLSIEGGGFSTLDGSDLTTISEDSSTLLFLRGGSISADMGEADFFILILSLIPPVGVSSMVLHLYNTFLSFSSPSS